MADGGNREEGMLKENKACSPVVRPASVLGVATLGDVSAEKKVRRIGKKIRQKRTMIRRGGRMSLVDTVYHFEIRVAGLERSNRNKYGVDRVRD